MSKPVQPTDAECHDDVAGLFQRLGERDDTRAYRDFSDSRPPPATPAYVAPAPLPPLPTAVKAAVPAAPVAVEPPATLAVPAPGQGAQAQVTGATTTPLQQLFQRLASVPVVHAGQSPLSRLREG